MEYLPEELIVGLCVLGCVAGVYHRVKSCRREQSSQVTQTQAITELESGQMKVTTEERQKRLKEMADAGVPIAYLEGITFA